MLLSINDPAVQEAFDAARANGGTLFPSPDDWRDCWIYFLMIDRFCNPDKAPHHLPYDAEFSGFQGGTFNGVRERLPYLQEMGVQALWLSPVLKNAAWDDHAYHGYGVQNFLEIEPRFGSVPDKAGDELRELVDAAHKMGIYVILDVILHHAGNVFAYAKEGQECDELDWQDDVQPIRWRDEAGKAREDWADCPPYPSPEAAVWPRELQGNVNWTRRGNSQSDAQGFHAPGDFSSLKAFDADRAEGDEKPLWDILIQSHQYLIAQYDVDGFRIDTLKFISPEFARAFGSQIREFAAAVGKKNFFTFGEIYDTEETVARFVGRGKADKDQPIGVDAALDYPLFYELPSVVKGLPGVTPADVAEVFQKRAEVLKNIKTAHGIAGQDYVTFLDNQDQNSRFGHRERKSSTNALTLGLGCLFTLQGVPCVYYGTEQGLTGHKTKGRMDDSHVREALWGKRKAFNTDAPLFQAVAALAALRRDHRALRTGGQFFRPLSSDGKNFDLSRLPAGVLSFSRLLDGVEILVVANTNSKEDWRGEVIVDGSLHPAGDRWGVLWSNQPDAAAPAPIADHPEGSVEVCEPDGRATQGPARTLPVALRPAELQILASEKSVSV